MEINDDLEGFSLSVDASSSLKEALKKYQINKNITPEYLTKITNKGLTILNISKIPLTKEDDSIEQILKDAEQTTIPVDTGKDTDIDELRILVKNTLETSSKAVEMVLRTEGLTTFALKDQVIILSKDIIPPGKDTRKLKGYIYVCPICDYKYGPVYYEPEDQELICPTDKVKLIRLR